MSVHSRLGLASGWGNINNLRFNQDSGCYICSMNNGLRVFNTDPLREQTHLTEQSVGSVGVAEMLFRTNLVAFVSGGPRPRYGANIVMIFDDKLGKCVLQFTFPSPVLSVRLKRDKFVVVCVNKIFVYSFPHNPQKLFSIETRENPRGLCELSPLLVSDRDIIAFPGFKTGSLQVVDLAITARSVSTAPVSIDAHRSELWCLAISQRDATIATASAKGTLIRIWDSVMRVMLIELRRGSDVASLYCINFSSDGEWLCCSSDKGTVHIFALNNKSLNRRSTLGAIGVPGAYAGSQWSLAQFTVPQEVACICAFGKPGRVYAVCLDGSFHKYNFSPEGICSQVSYDVFTEICEDCEWQALTV